VLVTLQGFGSIWERRPQRQVGDSTKFRGAAYYNTTGVVVNAKVRYRWRIGGKIRFNSTGGFSPNYPSRALNRVFECEAPEPRPDGWNQILFKAVLTHRARPDAYLFVVSPDNTGRVDFASPFWKAANVQAVSISEDTDQQQALVLMPAYSWVRGELGTFFVEPSASQPWLAELTMGQAG
jgi:hypothetical protein